MGINHPKEDRYDLSYPFLLTFQLQWQQHNQKSPVIDRAGVASVIPKRRRYSSSRNSNLLLLFFALSFFLKQTTKRMFVAKRALNFELKKKSF